MTAKPLPINKVRSLYEKGDYAYGAYVTFPTSAVVEVAALAGLDFVRLDAYHVAFNRETAQDMIRTAYAHDVTPWVRVRNDAWEIMMTLDLGAQVITIPNVGTAEEARSAVASTYHPPKGEREMSRPLRFRAHSAQDYLEWVNANVLVSCQIEGTSGIENYEQIIKTDGVAIVQTGRGDLSLARGGPGAEFHPKVLEVEKRIVETALDHGKQVSLLHPMTEEGLERAREWKSRGVRILTFDSEYRVLMREYGQLLAGFRGS